MKYRHTMLQKRAQRYDFLLNNQKETFYFYTNPRRNRLEIDVDFDFFGLQPGCLGVVGGCWRVFR